MPGGTVAGAWGVGPDEVYTVSRLTREVREVLEGAFCRDVWVEGELSNLARPVSGHLYFSLKDSEAVVRCALFRRGGRGGGSSLRDGLQVRVRGRVSLYERRGDFQLIVEHLEPAGEGLLQRRLEQLKRRLQAEGLFDPTRKRALPEGVSTIGVLTSLGTAALRDVLSVLRRRYPLARVVIYPAPVQGPAAAPALARMLQIASSRAECDVLLLVRGGGSLEDLWPFNEEQVARAIAACALPLVSGIGHEIDYTIADLVADLRAPTPSAAAELVSPDREKLCQLLAGWQETLNKHLRAALEHGREFLRDWGSRLRHPRRLLRAAAQDLDERELRLAGIVRRRLRGQRAAFEELLRRLPGARQRLALLAPASADLGARSARAAVLRLRELRLALRGLSGTLEALGPERVLRRGYAILRAEGRIVRSAAELRVGARVSARLGQGGARLEVLEVLPDAPAESG